MPSGRRSTTTGRSSCGRRAGPGSLYPPQNLGARQSPRHLAEGIATMLVALPLVPRRAGRREQHHGGALGFRLYLGLGGIHRSLEIAAATEFDIALELAGKHFCGLADQEGMTHPIEIGRERRHTTLLRLATEDPVDVFVGGQSARRGVGVGCLALVYIITSPTAATCSWRCGRPG